MKKNNKRSIILKLAGMLLAVVMIICITIGGTVAWLTANSETVKNTFSVGDITITLDETSNLNIANRTTANAYKIIPGGTDSKDPLVTVNAESEKCYVYVLVNNQMLLNKQIVATPNIDTTTWIPVARNEAQNIVLYRYKDIVDATTQKQTCQVFTTVTYSKAIKADDDTALNGKTIVIDAYAHQSENIGADTSISDTNAINWANAKVDPDLIKIAP